MALKTSLDTVIVHLSRLALAGRSDDVHAYLRKSLKPLSRVSPQLGEELVQLLAANPSGNVFRDVGQRGLPVDEDSQLSLLKVENLQDIREPLLSVATGAQLHQVIKERRHAAALTAAGLSPARSLLFVGPPGVGKTLSARWIACQLGLPLLTLDLATVMSSYLGKTGANIRSVLEKAKHMPCVLLLDEFDSIAKRRDDTGDVGELKRLVTVILQEIDAWPSTNILIAATNHGDLLDPAVWRRFDLVIEFEKPTRDLAIECIRQALGEDESSAKAIAPVLCDIWNSQSYSDIMRRTLALRRSCIVNGDDMTEVISKSLSANLKNAPLIVRKQAAIALQSSGYSDRSISNLTGMSRDTLRKQRK